MSAFFRKKTEELSSGQPEVRVEKSVRKWFQRRDQASETPLEKAAPSDLRFQDAQDAGSVSAPPRTFFATEPEFKQPEAQSITDTVVEVALESVDIHNLPINWESLAQLGRAIQGVTGRFTDLAALKPPRGVQEFLPMLASVIAHKNNPEIPVELPTQEQIKAAKPWLESIQRFLSRFSERAARGLGNYAEREGEKIIQDLGEKITDFADFVGTIENPQAELLREMALVYRHLQQGTQAPIEAKVEQFFRDLQWAKSHPEAYEDTSQFLNSRDFPVLLKGLSKLNVSLASFDAHTAGIAGAEFMQGIETFLRRHGVPVNPAPRPTEFDLFDFSTWERGLAEWFATEKLEQVKEHLPGMLSSAYEALPKSGKELRDQIYVIAENIYALHKRGYSAVEIAQNMFPGMGEVRTLTSASKGLQERIVNDMGWGGVAGIMVDGFLVFHFGANALLLFPVAVLGGMGVGAITGAIGIFNFLKKQAGKKS